MGTTAPLAALRACRALQRVDTATLEALAASARVESLPADTRLVAWGEATTALYVVIDGEVALTRATAGGGSSSRTLRRAGIFSEAGAVQPLPAHIGARLTSASTILSIAYASLAPVLATSATLREALVDLATVRDHEREIVAAMRRSSLAGATQMRRMRERLDEADVEHYAAGATLVTQGSKPFGAFFLLEGSLEQVRHEGATATVVDTVYAGEILCDYALTAPTPVPEPLELRASTPVQIVRFPSLDARAATVTTATTTVDLRALVGPSDEGITELGRVIVAQLRGAHGDAISKLRLRFGEVSDARVEASNAPVIELTLPADARAGEALGAQLARYNRFIAMALVDATGLTDEQASWIAPQLRGVIHAQRHPDDPIPQGSLRELDALRVGLVSGAGTKPWAPATLRLPRGAAFGAARPGSEVHDAIARVGRSLTGRRVGVALGGGGAWGYAHVGLLKGMAARGIPVDVLAGCSFGAVVGAYYAALGDRGLDQVKSSGPRLSRAVHLAMISSESVSRTVEKELGTHFIESLLRPYFPVATDISSGAQRTIRFGGLHDGVRASGAFPGMFTPVTSASGRLVDGGIVNNVPEDVPAREGAQLVIASNIVSAPSKEPVPTPMFQGRWGRALHEFDPIQRVRDLVRSMLVLMHTAGASDAYLADVTFSPPVPDVVPWDFSQADRVIEHARESLDRSLAEIESRWRVLAAPLLPGTERDEDEEDRSDAVA
ncbi:MAG: patatin-like phospholipase family protein [Polyangiales bacterium]